VNLNWKIICPICAMNGLQQDTRQSVVWNKAQRRIV
jgi:hypothetical protein